MRSIVGALAELLSVFVSGVVTFFVLIIYAIGFVLLLTGGAICGSFLLIALAESVYRLATHSHHAGVTALAHWVMPPAPSL